MFHPRFRTSPPAFRRFRLLSLALTTTPVLSYVQSVENTEQGFFYVDESGNFVFRDRHYSVQNPAAITSNGVFANDANTAHFKFLQGSIIPADDALDLWNDAPVSATTNAAIGVTGDVQDAPNLDSQRWYFKRTIQGFCLNAPKRRTPKRLSSLNGSSRTMACPLLSSDR